MEEQQDKSTVELREAHDVLAERYAEQLADVLETMPAEQAVLSLFITLAGANAEVVDVGCGTGRLAPYLAAHGLKSRGIDLSPEMIRVAERDYPGFDFQVADVRELPFATAELHGAVCWYSLMFLPPIERPRAYAELARVLTPGSPVAMAFKQGGWCPSSSGRVPGSGHRVRRLVAITRRDHPRHGRCRLRHRLLGGTTSAAPGRPAAGLSRVHSPSPASGRRMKQP